MRRARASRQLTFDDVPKWGGRRKGAGRKPGPRPRVRHRARPAHAYYNPSHVTLRALRRLPAFRNQRIYAAFERAVRDTNEKLDDFGIVEFSIQDDHVHAIIEAQDKASFSRGMRSFVMRAVRQVNRALGRTRGRIWADRYHRRDLTSPRQVRSGLVYVLGNYKKHYRVTNGMPRIDPFSSAPWFEGWVAHRKPPDEARPGIEARTFLLRSAWKRHGLIHPGEAPRAHA
jgi:REP element-mobilizing transposase RayT